MPLITREPQNGGVGTGLSIATSERPTATVSLVLGGDPAGLGDPSGSFVPGLAFGGLGLLGRVQRRVEATLAGHHPVHQVQALERVPGVPHVAVEDSGEVVLDIGPGERRAAEQDRVALGYPPGVHLLQVLLHHHGRLDQQPGHPDGVGVGLLGRGEDRRHRLLDPDVDDLIAVVGQDDVHEVLADVVHVALDRGQHDRALALGVGLLHVRLEVRDRGLHHLRRGEHERQLHGARPEQLADRLHAGQQRVVDDLQRAAGLQGLVEIGLQPVALAVHDSPLQPLVQRQRGQLGGP